MKQTTIRRKAVRQEERPPSPLASIFASTDLWLAGRRLWVISAIVLLSVLARATYFTQLQGGPLMHQHEWAQSDMAFFDLWARDIAGGDILADKSLHPQHDWHKRMSSYDFQLHPEDLQRLTQKAGHPLNPDEASAMLWDQWFGQKSFHQEPLYPYLLAAVYKLLGYDVRWMFLLQMMAGVVANVLIYLLARRYFGELAGVLAGAMAVMCSPMLYYELLLLRDSLIVMMGLLLVHLTAVAIDRGRWYWWLCASVAFGLAQMLKATFALMLLPVLAVLTVWAILWALRQRKLRRGQAKPEGQARSHVLGPAIRRLLGTAGVMSAGALLGLSPMIVRNVMVGLPALAPSSVGTITYICANTPDYPPEGGFRVSEPLATVIMHETNGQFMPAVRRTLAEHTLGSFAWQLWRKFQATWYWYEVPCNANFYYYRMHAGILWLPMTFRILGPLAIVGLVLGLRGIRRSWPLYALVISTMATMLIFYPGSRFRVPLMAAVIPFAALSLVTTLRWMAQRKPRYAIAVAAMIGAAFWVNRPLPPGTHAVRSYDCTVAYDVYYRKAVRNMIQAGNAGGAAKVMADSLKYRPPEVDQLSLLNPPRDEEELAFARLYAFYYHVAAEVGRAAAQAEDAARYEQRARQLDQVIQPFTPPTNGS